MINGFMNYYLLSTAKLQKKVKRSLTYKKNNQKKRKNIL